MAIKKTKQGFTIFFAMLVGGLALAIGIAIYDLTVREIDLASTATQSQYAIYAADTGAECALYWDFKCTLGTCTSAAAANSAFATSSTMAMPSLGVYCGKRADSSPQDIAVDALAASPSTWPFSSNSAAATTTFTLTFSPQQYCATVTVAKSGNPTFTTITARGYNTCAAGAPNRLERVLQVTY